MVAEVVAGLQADSTPNALWFDGTLGAGGHSAALLAARPDSRVVACDLDPQALALAQERLAPFGGRARLHLASYEDAPRLLGADFGALDGALLDLGLSSMQLDTPERGFAFRHDAPLDMRFNPRNGHLSAADLLNSLSEADLADLLWRYGEERDSRRYARAIIAARPLQSTVALAEVIAKATRNPPHTWKIHPATQTFQALRIAVNDELGALERTLPRLLEALKSGGRLAIISFHSLEDRLVKDFFRREASACLCPPKQPICTCQHQPRLTLLTRKPLVASEAEISANPRARSAKLRLAEKR
jgi:16S rRNA (cytosine1402-N4)-methyltransferase